MDTLPNPAFFRRFGASALVVACAFAVAGCAGFGASGPSAGAIQKAVDAGARVRVVEVNQEVTRGVVAAETRSTFAQTFAGPAQRHGIIGIGDMLEVSIWEAPPAVLFSSGLGSALAVGAPSVAHSSDLSGQMVDADGNIVVPFAGTIRAAGLTPNELGRVINGRLAGKAHEPQTLVRLIQNKATEVTVVGEVATSRRIPLTPRNERLLDALADAGGVRQPVDKVVIQLTRGSTVSSRPLGAIIRDPAENIPLASGDVVTALFQPYSFQALGAFGVNAEVPFEATGLSLAQAIGRVGGLQDNRANIKGLFIFRFENPAALPPSVAANAPVTPEGKVPVIYKVNMGDPATFFAMQSFPIRDKDILYVSNAPVADIQKFVNLVSQMAFSIAGVVSTIP
jgi:polysaccharide export outer membrane protein